MKFKSGDKVKFLNKKGGGYVTSVLGNNIVKVVTETGFEYPVLDKELIKVEPQSGLEKYFDEDFVLPNELSKKLELQSTEETDDALQNNKNNNTEAPQAKKDTHRNGEIKLDINTQGDEIDKGLVLAYIPVNQDKLKDSELSISIINYSEYTVYFSLYMKKSRRLYNNISSSSISPYSRLNLCTIERNDLIYWLEGNLQAFFVKDELKVVPNPVNTDIKLKITHFDINDNYRSSNVLESKALMVMLNNIYYNENLILKEDDKPKDIIIQEEKQKDIAAVIPKQLIDRHKTGLHKAEVDLHISALREDYSNMKSGEILTIQKQYFIDSLESAMINNYSEVVFIHGIGNGVLREAILYILRTQYDEFYVRNAPFSQYGNGAIIVTLYE